MGANVALHKRSARSYNAALAQRAAEGAGRRGRPLPQAKAPTEAAAENAVLPAIYG